MDESMQFEKKLKFVMFLFDSPFCVTQRNVKIELPWPENPSNTYAPHTGQLFRPY